MLLLLLMGYLPQATAQNYCAVLNLVSDGTIPKKNCKLIADKISEIVATKSNYVAFDRRILADSLQQMVRKKYPLSCLKPKCLAAIGRHIGVNAIIGGMIIHRSTSVDVKLYLIDAVHNQVVNSVSLSTTAKKNMFLNSEIPALMKNLLNPPMSTTGISQNNVIKTEKKLYTNPFLYIGTFFVGGAAAGVYYYKYYYKKGEHSPSTDDNDQPLSMDDVPVRSRE